MIIRVSLIAALVFSWSAGNIARCQPEQSNEQASSLFQDFVQQVVLAPSGDRGALVDTFLQAVPSVPYLEGDSAIFIYRGSASSVSVAGDMTGWSPSIDLVRLVDTDFWYAIREYENTARLDYKLITNGSNWILDPRNPNLVSGGFGPNSELAMSGYIQPEEIEFRASIPHGVLVDSVFASTNLGNSRRIQLYLPPGFEASGSYRMILFHDGSEYLTLGSARNVLDNLIYDETIEPVVAVFVPPVDRNDEYGFAKTDLYEAFIVDEVVPWVVADYAVSTDPMERATTGPSLGGLISTQICYRNPDVFGLCGPFSPSFWVSDRKVINEVINGEARNIRFYLDWGTYEPGIAATGNEMVSVLEGKGYEVVWNAWHEGHSWGSWRAHLDNMLSMFFPKVTSGSTGDGPEPHRPGTITNYPNPFSHLTTLEFELSIGGMTSIDVYDIAGRRVSQPVASVYPPGKHQVSIEGFALPAGTYLVRVTTDDLVNVTRVVVAR